MRDIFGTESRRRIEHFQQYLQAREKAAAFAMEAKWSLWMAQGCPADRTGLLGLSLLEKIR